MDTPHRHSTTTTHTTTTTNNTTATSTPQTTPQTPHARPHTTQHSSPKFVHVGLSRASEVHQSKQWILHIFSLRIDREEHVRDSSNHSPYLIKLWTLREMVRLVFSPPKPSFTNDLHVSIAAESHCQGHSRRSPAIVLNHFDIESRRGYLQESHGCTCRLSALVSNFSPL